MEKKAQLYEIIIKLSFAIFGFIASVFVVKNIISMLPLFESFSYDERGLYDAIYKTNIGNILNDIGIVSIFNFNLIVKGFFAFLANIGVLAIIFLLMVLVILILRFIFIKWTLLHFYLKISGLVILSFILKYLSFAIVFGFTYDYGTYSLALSFVIGSATYLIFSITQLFFLCYFIIKFILNISNDINYYCSH